MSDRWPEPQAGDILWCHFPDNVHPKPKPRPTLVLTVIGDKANLISVLVAYGTSKRTSELHRGEFAIRAHSHPDAYEAAGLSYDTKFDLGRTVELPYTQNWFSVPPAAPHGQNPKLGTLHPSLVHAVEAAYHAAVR